MRRLCVFCGSRQGGRAVFSQRTRELGAAIAQRGLELVYGGGNIGLMGILADAVLDAGGKVIGVLPQALVERELAHPRITETHIVRSMHERKALMADLADAFLALPGGYGTADEMFEMLTWKQLKFLNKPIGMLNLEHFFDPLLAWIDHTIDEGFTKPRYRDFLIVDDNVESLLARVTQASV